MQEATWKLVFNSGAQLAKIESSPTGGFELYNLDADPLETRNVAAASPEQVRRLRKDLVAWMRKARAMGEEEGGDPEIQRALRALGYVN